jgi:hypothetical protein
MYCPWPLLHKQAYRRTLADDVRDKALMTGPISRIITAHTIVVVDWISTKNNVGGLMVCMETVPLNG